MSVITILIVDDSTTIRAMLEEVLGREPGFRLIGSAADAETAIRLVAEHHPDVTTLDIAMPGVDGLSLLDTIHLRTHAVMLTSRCEAANDSFHRGALGFFDKSRIMRDGAKLVKIVRAAAEGKQTRAVA
ncbi:response regulator [Sphingomonas sp. LB-2]|uniref:response regulator n=1 Tax=Sphingomonas caeni TaxID=2984949 RepID=UPI00222FDE5F|nr:response regulator [Sphingomonas caeni]MCW3846474.1 response regulator [Sphingomonas caeni]